MINRISSWTLLFVVLLTSCAGMEVLEDDIEIPYETWCAPNQQIEITRVYDGDTFNFWENGEEKKIRMLGVDAPEIADTPEESDCYGEESAAFLRELLVGQEVVLEFDRECVDLYQRTLSWIILRGDDPQVVQGLQAVPRGVLGAGGGAEPRRRADRAAR